MSTSLLFSLPGSIFSQAAIDGLTINVLTDDPVGQPSQFIETIPFRGLIGRLVEKRLFWRIQNSKMILFQQASTLPPEWNGLL